jgi:hypothetical protein
VLESLVSMPLFKKEKAELIIRRNKELERKVSKYVRYVEDNIANINVDNPDLDLQEVDDVIERLASQTKYIPVTADITVLVEFKYKKNNNESSVEQVKEVVTKNLIPRIRNITQEVKRISIISLVLFGLGFIMLLASILVTENGFSSSAIQQVFSIFSWVFIWTSLEKMIFERIDMVRHKQILKRLYFAEFELDPKSIIKKSSKLTD